jgi:hypothetical protein
LKGFLEVSHADATKASRARDVGRDTSS